MSEYIINGTSLTNIADAVRSVDGSASTLTPAQMETRLNAVKSSIDSALSALTAKGVEVHSGSTVHALAGLIQAIQAGGGNIASGTISWATVAGSIMNTEFVHNLGVVPILFIISPAFDISGDPSKNIGIHHIMTSSSSSLARYSSNEGFRLLSDYVYTVIRPMSEYSPSSFNSGIYVDENKAIYKTYIDSVFPVTAGDVYNWIAVG